jgi:hypothetical protein
MLEIGLAFAISSMCFVPFSSVGQDGMAQAVDREACSPLIEDSCTPVDTPLSEMTLSIIKSIKTSSMDFSAALNASDIRTRGKKFAG